MRIFLFESQTRDGLHAFAGDIAGTRLPDRVGPWRLVSGSPPGRILASTSAGNGAVSFAVSNDNTVLLPVGSVTVSAAAGSGYQIQIVPASYQFGVAHVTLQVTDSAGATAAEGFQLWRLKAEPIAK